MIYKILFNFKKHVIIIYYFYEQKYNKLVESFNKKRNKSQKNTNEIIIKSI